MSTLMVYIDASVYTRKKDASKTPQPAIANHSNLVHVPVYIASTKEMPWYKQCAG